MSFSFYTSNFPRLLLLLRQQQQQQKTRVAQFRKVRLSCIECPELWNSAMMRIGGNFMMLLKEQSFPWFNQTNYSTEADYI